MILHSYVYLNFVRSTLGEVAHHLHLHDQPDYWHKKWSDKVHPDTGHCQMDPARAHGGARAASGSSSMLYLVFLIDKGISISGEEFWWPVHGSAIFRGFDPHTIYGGTTAKCEANFFPPRSFSLPFNPPSHANRLTSSTNHREINQRCLTVSSRRLATVRWLSCRESVLLVTVERSSRKCSRS